MEGDDAEPRSRPQQPFGGGKPPVELAELARREGATADLQQPAILNGIAPETPLAAGRLVKLVQGGELPGGARPAGSR